MEVEVGWGKHNYYINQGCFGNTLSNYFHFPSYSELGNHLQNIVCLVNWGQLNLQPFTWFSSCGKKRPRFLNWQLPRLLLFTLVWRGTHIWTQIWKRAQNSKIEYILQISDTLSPQNPSQNLTERFRTQRFKRNSCWFYNGWMVGEATRILTKQTFRHRKVSRCSEGPTLACPLCPGPCLGSASSTTECRRMFTALWCSPCGLGGRSGSPRVRMMEVIKGEVGRDGGPTMVGGGKNQRNISVPVSLMICIFLNGYLKS